MATTPYFPQYSANPLASRYNTSTSNKNFLGLDQPAGPYTGPGGTSYGGVAIDPKYLGVQNMVQNTAAGGIGPRANDLAISLNYLLEDPTNPLAKGQLGAFMPAAQVNALAEFDTQQKIQDKQLADQYAALFPNAQQQQATNKTAEFARLAALDPAQYFGSNPAVAANMAGLAGLTPPPATPNFPTYTPPRTTYPGRDEPELAGHDRLCQVWSIS